MNVTETQLQDLKSKATGKIQLSQSLYETLFEWPLLDVLHYNKQTNLTINKNTKNINQEYAYST